MDESKIQNEIYEFVAKEGLRTFTSIRIFEKKTTFEVFKMADLFQ